MTVSLFKSGGDPHIYRKNASVWECWDGQVWIPQSPMSAQPYTKEQHELAHPDLGHQEMRVLWNRMGLCARVACESAHEGWQNSANHLLYCRACKALILRHAMAELTFTRVGGA
jgi:hypothetical protein